MSDVEAEQADVRLESTRLEDDRPLEAASGKIPFASVLMFGLLFALVAVLVTLVPLAERTYSMLFSEKTAIQPALPEGRPLPAPLVWSQTFYDTLVRVGTLSPGVQLGSIVFLGLIFVYGILRILNPTFRLTTGVDWDRHLLVKTYMHSWPVTKAFLIAVAAFLPAFIVWIILGWLLGAGPFSLWLRLALLGAAAWLLFSRSGLAGNYEDGSYELPRDRGAILSLVARGAMAGTAGWLVLQLPTRTPPETLFAFEHSIGYIGQQAWFQIAEFSCGPAAALGFGLGGVAVALGWPDRTLTVRLWAAVGPAFVLAAGIAAGRSWIPGYLASHDFAFEPGPTAEATLAARAGIGRPAPIPQTALLLGADRALALQFSGRSTATGLPADPESARRIDAYLKQKGDRSSLNGPGFVTMFDAASLDWSQADCLRVCLLNLRDAPDLAWQSHLMDILAGGCASPSPEIVKLADSLMDESLLAYPDRQSWVMTGDLYAGLGEADRARQCYERANLPASQVRARADEKLAFAAGSLSGRVLMNGRPAPGVRVGIVAERSIRRMLEMRGESPGLMNPFALSWIGAATTTDVQGQFNLGHLLGGRYRVVVQSAAIGTNAPSAPTGQDREFAVHHGPDVVAIDPSAPSATLGDIDISDKPPR